MVIDADRRLARQVRALSRRRMVFFAGLPGTGKSLLAHQLAHLAATDGRRVHLLQWDVARPVFEASTAGRSYPPVDGVTQAVIRKAAGLWSRQAVAAWSERHPERHHLLVGETPFVGNRFIELAQRGDDDAEALLAAPSCRFVITVPSVAVREFLESERERRAASPLHPREREDAPPHVLRALWQELTQVARQLGMVELSGRSGHEPPYDSSLYRQVYDRLLQRRQMEVVPLDVVLPTGTFSVYDFAVTPTLLTPTDEDAERFIREVERRYRDIGELELEISRWWQV